MISFQIWRKVFPSKICSDNTKKKFSYQTNKDWIRFIMLQRIIWFMEKFCFKWIFRDLTFDDIGLKWNFSKKNSSFWKYSQKFMKISYSIYLLRADGKTCKQMEIEENFKQTIVKCCNNSSGNTNIWIFCLAMQRNWDAMHCFTTFCWKFDESPLERRGRLFKCYN